MVESLAPLEKLIEWDMVGRPWELLFSLTVLEPPLTCEEADTAAGTLRLLAAFTMSVLWVAALSWAMTWTATLIGCVLQLDSAVVGVTLVATGTSLSGIVSSAIVAKQGHGDMAVANALGSNVFCIFVGLGLPWFLSTTMVHERSYTIASVTQGVVLEAIVAIFGTLFGVVVLLWGNKWNFTAWIGSVMLLWYAMFVAYVVVTQVA